VASGNGAPATSGMVCSNGGFVACGGSDQACCQTNTCGAAGCCVNNRCRMSGAVCSAQVAQVTCMMGSCSSGPGGFSCGAMGQACCQTSVIGGSSFCTATGLVCSGGGIGGNAQCVACGGPGQPCCAGNQCTGGGCCDQRGNLPAQCVGAGTMCSGNQGMCSGGGCNGGTCGKAGQPCCESGVSCTDLYTQCVTQGGPATCRSCGGSGQPCCVSGNTASCAAPFVCGGAGTRTCSLPTP